VARYEVIDRERRVGSPVRKMLVQIPGCGNQAVTCPVCSEACYDCGHLESSHGKERVPWKEFHTIPIGPQLQALYRDPESVAHVHYLCLERSCVLSEIEQTGYLGEYSDVLHGTDLIEAFRDMCIREDDLVLMFSMDRA